MKASISLDKEWIKLKGNEKKVIVRIHPSQGEPWTEPIDEEFNVRQLYKIQNDEYYIEPNIYGELHSAIISMWNYMTGIWKIMKLKQEDVGPFRSSRKK